MYKVPVILLLTFLILGKFTTASIGKYLPFSDKPIPSKTPGPIDIPLDEVKHITTFPLILSFNGSEKAIAKNTGYSVEVFLDQPITSNAVIAGVLGFNLYAFRQIRFYWADSADGFAANTVNHKDGAPIEVYVYYYNIRYGSLRNALNFRDGVVQITYRIHVKGSNPNPYFEPFAQILSKIQHAGSTIETNINTSSKFYLFTPPNTSFFVYPGAYGNQSTGELYYCATVIVTAHTPDQYISTRQFQETFLALLDYEGKPLVNKVKQEPLAKRPIVQSSGILKIPNLAKIPSHKGS